MIAEVIVTATIAIITFELQAHFNSAMPLSKSKRIIQLYGAFRASINLSKNPNSDAFIFIIDENQKNYRNHVRL
jgi:hypothetical protein